MSVVAVALVVGGILLLILEYIHKEKKTAIESIEGISDQKCMAIGCCQVLAMIPGVSRVAVTTWGGLFLDVRRKTIVKFSFLLAVPTMVVAIRYDLLKSGMSFSWY